MKQWHRGTRARAGILGGCAVLSAVLLTLNVAQAQFPPAPQIKKDGTALKIEDYASLPLSSLRLEGAYPPAFDARGQLGKSNMLISEPAAAPQAAARLFVVEQNGILYTLDKKSRAFTP